MSNDNIIKKIPAKMEIDHKFFFGLFPCTHTEDVLTGHLTED